MRKDILAGGRRNLLASEAFVIVATVLFASRQHRADTIETIREAAREVRADKRMAAQEARDARKDTLLLVMVQNAQHQALRKDTLFHGIMHQLTQANGNANTLAQLPLLDGPLLAQQHVELLMQDAQ
jgi:hypothetical protein